jgi:hypothetical protein
MVWFLKFITTKAITVKLPQLITQILASMRGSICTCMLAALAIFAGSFTQKTYAQCDYQANTAITLAAAGGNTVPDYTNAYVLTDYTGTILELAYTPSFNGQAAGLYIAYNVNYRTSAGIANLQAGQKIASITGTCFQVSAPLLLKVCGITRSCDFLPTNPIVFAANGGNIDGGYTNTYVLTNNAGVIISTNSSPTFPAQPAGNYLVYNVNYQTAAGANGLVPMGSINQVNGSCLKVSNPLAISVCSNSSISGTIYNDVNGSTDNTVVSASGTDGGGLFVILTDVNGLVITSAAVDANGIYTLPNLPDGAYKLVLSTTPAATNSQLTTASLAVGWVSTGEHVGGGTGYDMPVDGILPVTISGDNVSNADFGIEQTPTAGSGNATVVNLGGTNSQDVPANAFTNTGVSSDPGPGMVAAIRIISFPAGANSITVNGDIYTAATFPSAGLLIPSAGNGSPSQPIKVDPIDGNPVLIQFVAVDNGGKESTNIGTATINFTDLTISGTVYNDADGNTNSNIDGIATNSIGTNTIYVSLIDPVTGFVIASKQANSDGIYSFGTSDGVQAGVSVNVAVSNGLQTIGSAPVLTLANAANTAEGTLASGDGDPNGITTINMLGVNVVANFGIDLLPTAGSGTFNSAYPAGTTNITIPPATFTNTLASSDVAPGTITSIRILALPAGASTITIAGTTYGPGHTLFPAAGVVVLTDPSGNPTQTLTVDPVDGTPVIIRFVAIDNAGKPSANEGTATISFSPDLIPIITVVPTTQYGITNFTAVINIYEVNNVATNNSVPVNIYVSKNSIVNLTFNQNATSMSDAPIENSQWVFDGTSNSSYYIFTTNAILNGRTRLSFGLNGTLTPGAGTGKLNISALVAPGSGGEIKIDNNINSATITFFP